MRRNWTADEIKILARAYFHVLRCEHNGEAVNKRQTLREQQDNREAQREMRERNRRR